MPEPGRKRPGGLRSASLRRPGRGSGRGGSEKGREPRHGLSVAKLAGTDTEDAPAEHERLGVLLAVCLGPGTANVPAVDVETALDLKGNPEIRPAPVEAPAARGMETKLGNGEGKLVREKLQAKQGPPVFFRAGE